MFASTTRRRIVAEQEESTGENLGTPLSEHGALSIRARTKGANSYFRCLAKNSVVRSQASFAD
jgi:hypothetical protein